MLFFTLAMLIITCAPVHADQPFSIETCNNLISQRILEAATKRVHFAPATSTAPSSTPLKDLDTKDGLTRITYGQDTVSIQQDGHARTLHIPQWHRITCLWAEDCQTLGLVLRDERDAISTSMHRFCYRLDLECLTSEQQILCERASTAWQAGRAYLLEVAEDEMVYETLPATFQHKALFKKDNALVSQPQPKNTRALLYAFTALKTAVSYLIGL